MKISVKETQHEAHKTISQTLIPSQTNEKGKQNINIKGYKPGSVLQLAEITTGTYFKLQHRLCRQYIFNLSTQVY